MEGELLELSDSIDFHPPPILAKNNKKALCQIENMCSVYNTSSLKAFSGWRWEAEGRGANGIEAVLIRIKNDEEKYQKLIVWDNGVIIDTVPLDYYYFSLMLISCYVA